jgi:hypothetical protein
MFSFPQDTGLMRHVEKNLCLDASGLNSGDDVYLRACQPNVVGQQWEFQHFPLQP